MWLNPQICKLTNKSTNLYHTQKSKVRNKLESKEKHTLNQAGNFGIEQEFEENY